MQTISDLSQGIQFTDLRRDKAVLIDWNGVPDLNDHEVYMARVGARAGTTLQIARGLILPNNRLFTTGRVDLRTFEDNLMRDFEQHLRRRGALKREDIRWLEDYDETKLNMRVIEIIKKYVDAGVKFAVMTNQDREVRGKVIKRQLRDNGLHIPIIFPSDTGFAKPDHEAYLRAIHMLQWAFRWPSNYKDIAFVDDLEKNVRAAIASTATLDGPGVHGIRYTNNSEELDRRLEKFLLRNASAQPARKVPMHVR